MPINRISGNILQDDLVRGANLSFQGNLIYIDVVNDRVGIANGDPQQALDVTGNVRVGNIQLLALGNVDMGNGWITNLQDPLESQDAATKSYVDSQISSGFTIEDDTANTTVVSGGDTLRLQGTANQVAVTITAVDTVDFALTPDVDISGNLAAQGNVSANNIQATTNITANTALVQGNITATTILANISGITGDFTGNVTAATFVGNVSGNISAGGSDSQVQFNDAGIIAGSAGFTFDKTSNAVVVAGNVSAANLSVTNTVSATTITAAGNVSAGNINATNSITGSQAVLSGSISTANVLTNAISGSAIVVYGATVDFELSGNISASGRYIQDIANPISAQDAATKQYVDDAVSTGITIHDPVRVESPDSAGSFNAVYAQGGNVYTVTDTVAGNTVVFSTAANLQVNDQLWFSSSFDGVVANLAYFVVSTPNTSAAVLSTQYNGVSVANITSNTGLSQSVRVNSGQGATLTNAGANAALVIDGVTVNTNDRVLIYNQTQGYENGVYVVTVPGDAGNAWVLTRAADMNTYIPDNIAGVDAGDYFFVQEGDSGAGESYVMTAPVGPLILGLDTLTFTQFSASQVYSANTNAGLNLQGTIFSAKIDSDTTYFDPGGNIAVRPGANLVTPNIGDATGNSLTLSGNGLISAANITLSGNVSASGVVANVSGATAVFSGNVTGGNINTSGDIGVQGNVNAGNVNVANAISSASITASGNITANTVLANIDGVTATFTGNVTANTFFGDLVGNITGNIDAGGANTTVQFNDDDVLAGSTAFTFDKSANTVTVTGNVDAEWFNGNLSGTTIALSGNVTADTVLANVDGATATFSGNVTGDTFLGNIDGSTGVFAGNITADTLLGNVNGGTAILSGNVTGTTFLGNVEGTYAVFSGNVTADTFIGNISGNIDAGGANTTVQFNDDDVLAGSPAFTFDKSANIVTVTGNIDAEWFNGNVSGTTADFNGNVDAEWFNGNVSGTTAGFTGNVSADWFLGNVDGDSAVLQNSLQANSVTVTSTLDSGSITASGNIVGNILTANALTQTVVLTASGNITAANVIANSTVSAVTLSASGNVIANNAEITNSISAASGDFSGNVSADYFLGNIDGDTAVFSGNVTAANFVGTISNVELIAGSYTWIFDDSGNTSLANGTVSANVLDLSGALTGVSAVFSGNVTADTFIGNISGNIDAGGANTTVQFNDDDVLAGSTAFTFDKSSNVVTVSGNVSAANVTSSGLISATGNITGGNLDTAGQIQATGNITGGNLVTTGDVTTVTVTASGNVTGGNIGTAGLISATGNVSGGNIATAGVVDALGNVSGGNLVTIGLVSATGNITGGNVNTGGQIQATGNVNGGNLTTLGDVTGGTATITGNVSGETFLGNIEGGYAEFTGNVTAHTFFGNIQGNVDAGGANTEIQFNDNDILAGSPGFTFDKTANLVTVSGNVSAANLSTSGSVSATGNVSGGNVSTPGLIAAGGNITGDNLAANNLVGAATVVATGNISGNNLISSNDVTTATVTATGNITANNAAITGELSADSGSFVGTVTANTVIANVQATSITASGNITGANLVSNAAVVGATLAISGNAATGNLINSNVVYTANVTASGTVLGDRVTANSLVSSTTVTATGNIIGANIIANSTVFAGTIEATGNIDASNVNVVYSVQAANADVTYVNAGTLYSNDIQGTDIEISGSNVDLILTGNLDLGTRWINRVANPVSAQDAATKQYVDDSVSAGLTIHPPVRVESPNSAGSLNATYSQGGNTFTVTDTVAGNTVVFSTAANLQVNDQLWFSNSFQGIAANTAYFVVSAPNTSAAVLSQTYDGEPVSNITSASSLTESVRVNSGQGATLTNAGANAALVIDGVTVGTNDRVLIYSQTQGYENGVYVVTVPGDAGNVWVLTRAADMDTYIPDNINGVDAGDYFFVQEGDTGAGESYVMTDPVGPVIIGYNTLTFTQFSASSTYQAGNGLSLNGTIFSVNVDDDTTAIVADVVVVKTGANLVQPNIGNAIGNSLTLSGNGLLSATNVTASANVSAANVNATTALIAVTGVFSGNASANNLISSNDVTAATVTASGNVSVGNLSSAFNVAAITVDASGNITGANINTAGEISATGNISGGNLETLGKLSAAEAVVTGNITVDTVLGNIQGDTGTFTGTVSANNFVGNVDAGGANTQIQFNDDDILAGSSAFTFDKSSNLVSASGNISAGNVTSQGQIEATGDVSANNVISSNDVSTVTVNASGNINGANLVTAGKVTAGTIDATGNITTDGFFVGTFAGNISGNLTVPGANTEILFNADGNAGASAALTFDYGSNVLTASGFVTVGGNLTAANVISNATVSSVTVTASGNVSAGNVETTDAVVAMGNVTGANFDTPGVVLATGNVSAGNVVSAADVTTVTVTASGNVSAGNVLVGYTVYSNAMSAVSGDISIEAGAGNANINLRPTGSGTIDANGAVITGVAAPVSSSDATNKNYVDSAVGNVTAKTSVFAATTEPLPTYTYDNGNQGVGATITGNVAGVLTLDGVSVATNEFVLVKDETGFNQPVNGIYQVTDPGSVSNVFVLTRSQDMDQSTEFFGARTFVGTGNTLAQTHWVCTNNDYSVVVGSDSIFFQQFAGNGTYQASNGINLVGNQFTANTDGVTTTIYSGNIAVKDDAQFVAPNIGNATGNTLDLAGLLEAGNIQSDTTLTVVGNVIYLEDLQLRAVSANTFGVYENDGVTLANFQIGNVEVAAISSGNSVIGIAGPSGNAYITVAGVNDVLLVSTQGIEVTGNATANYFLGNGSALSGINVFSTIVVSGQSDVVADSIDDTLTLVAGTGIDIETDSGNDSITISTTTNIFELGGSMGLVTEPVTVSFDFGLVTSASNVFYNLGTVVVDGVVLNTNIVDGVITGNKLANNITISTTGNITCGNLVVTGNTATVTTENYPIGYLIVPQIPLTGNVTLALTDSGKHFYSTTAADLEITVPTNANAGFAVGSQVEVVVQALGNVLITTQPGVTLYLAGNSTAGNRTVESYGAASILKVATDTWFVRGQGVS